MSARKVEVVFRGDASGAVRSLAYVDLSMKRRLWGRSRWLHLNWWKALWRVAA